MSPSMTAPDVHFFLSLAKCCYVAKRFQRHLEIKSLALKAVAEVNDIAVAYMNTYVHYLISTNLNESVP